MSNAQKTVQMTPAEMRARRSEMEARVDFIKSRRVEIADRVGLAAVAPSAVPNEELEALREERLALSAEMDDLVNGLVVLRRMHADATSFGVRS